MCVPEVDVSLGSWSLVVVQLVVGNADLRGFCGFFAELLLGIRWWRGGRLYIGPRAPICRIYRNLANGNLANLRE